MLWASIGNNMFTCSDVVLEQPVEAWVLAHVTCVENITELMDNARCAVDAVDAARHPIEQFRADILQSFGLDTAYKHLNDATTMADAHIIKLKLG